MSVFVRSSSDLEETEDDNLPLTQVSDVPTAPTYESDVSCVICKKNLTALTIFERQVHQNRCLDHQDTQECLCPTCGKNLTCYNDKRRNSHVNICIDNHIKFKSKIKHELVEKPTQTKLNAPSDSICTSNTKSNNTIQDTEYSCIICKVYLNTSSISDRLKHVKQCGKRFGVKAKDLIDREKEDIGASNAFDVMMKASSGVESGSLHVRKRPFFEHKDAFQLLMTSSRTTTAFSNFPKKKEASSKIQGNRPNIKGKRRYNRSGWCPSFKKIEGTNPPFIVDGFKFASETLSTVYFLTHFHADHYGGITKNFKFGTIYCTEATANLDIFRKYIHPLPLSTPFKLQGVDITFLDANHCPGAVIILFQLPNGKSYLHTGDFRFNKSMLTYGALKGFLCGKKTNQPRRLDGVYLDTTYCNPKYTFPKQVDAISEVLKLMKRYLAQEKILFLFGSYSIGKERVFMEVAEKYNQKVFVEKSKYSMISCFRWPSDKMKLLTTESSASNMRVVPMNFLNFEQMQELLDKHRLRYHRVVGFRPTGWTFSKNSSQIVSTRKNRENTLIIHGVPYSEHSSFSELCDFLKAFKPKSIIPTVDCLTEASSKAQVNVLEQACFNSIDHHFS